MNIVKEFRYLTEELTVFYRNLNKDSSVRRKDNEVTNRKFKKLLKCRNEYERLKDVYNKSTVDVKLREEIREYANTVSKILNGIESILNERLQLSGTEKSETDEKLIPVDSDSSVSDTEEKMSEKFNLKTAASLLPVMNGTEIVTKQLIDAIELYDSMLDATGKSLLTTFILKKSLSESAKIRLNKTYNSNAELIVDLKNYFITKKSVSYLSTQLNNAKQGGKSIDLFGKSIEELLTDLTITQSEGNETALKILGDVNEKIAINSFANGLRNNDLRTIIKARNYSKLADAIQGAKDEEMPSNINGQVFHTRGNANFRRGSTNNRFVRGNNNFSRNQTRGISYNSNYNRGRNSRGNFNNNRPKGNNFYYGNNTTQRSYYTTNSNGQSNNVTSDRNCSGIPSEPFFRGPTRNY